MQNNVRFKSEGKNSLLTFTLRYTFFDLIENIQYPRSLNSEAIPGHPEAISGVSVANGKIITTSKWTNFSLFSHEKDGWTKSDIDDPNAILSLLMPMEQLLTVKNSESLR